MRRALRRLTALALVSAAFACTVPDYTFGPPEVPDAGGPDVDSAKPPSEGGLVDAGRCGEGEVLVRDHCYSFSAGALPCTAECPRGRLAVLETEDEAIEVAKALGRPPAGTRYYIGMYPIDGVASTKRTDFRWLDGAAVTYSHWAPNEPSGVDGATCVLQDVVVDAATEPFPAWFDHQKADVKYLLCERVP
ncbi:MAG: C-type lectin domain-containing protein [Labilithrix sp.]